MSDIPRARYQLEKALKVAALPDEARHHVEQALSFMTRERWAGRAPSTAKRITPEIKMRARELALANPSLGNRAIGAMLGVDGGRISETLTGKRGKKYALTSAEQALRR